MGVKMQLFEGGPYRSNFCLWVWTKSEVYKEKANTRDELVARVMNSAALIQQERLGDLRSATVLLPRGLKSALKTMVGFLNTYFEMLQFIEIIYIPNNCNQYVIYLSFIPFVRLFMRNDYAYDLSAASIFTHIHRINLL